MGRFFYKHFGDGVPRHIEDRVNSRLFYRFHRDWRILK